MRNKGIKKAHVKTEFPISGSFDPEITLIKVFVNPIVINRTTGTAKTEI